MFARAPRVAIKANGGVRVSGKQERVFWVSHDQNCCSTSDHGESEGYGVAHLARNQRREPKSKRDPVTPTDPALKSIRIRETISPNNCEQQGRRPNEQRYQGKYERHRADLPQPLLVRQAVGETEGAGRNQQRSCTQRSRQIATQASLHVKFVLAQIPPRSQQPLQSLG